MHGIKETAVLSTLLFDRESKNIVNEHNSKMPNQLLCYMYGETSLKRTPKSVKCPHYRGLRVMMERII